MGDGPRPVPLFFIPETPPLPSTLLPPTTELEAVNRILSAVGQSPVNALTVSGVPDVIEAVALLRQELMDLEAAGWSWNTDRNYNLQPQVDGTIPIPTGAIEVDPEDAAGNVVVRRNPATANLSLYDADTQSFQFDAPVPCRIVWAFPFEDIPQAARAFVAITSARKFQAQRVSSPTLDNYNAGDEQRAWNLLMRMERRTRDTNTFRVNPTAARMFRRRF